MEAGIVRLNLGAGAKRWKGFINVDLADNWTKLPPDVEADVTKTLPFVDGYADEVHAYHLFEHLPRNAAPRILKEWIRVLKPGGKLVLEMPCLDKILALFDHYFQAGKPIDPRLTMWGLFGDPGYENDAMVHRWCYSVAELSNLLTEAGMMDITEEIPQTHQPIRDMRLVSWRSPRIQS